MKKEKLLKRAVILLIAVIGLSLAACGGGGNVSEAKASTNFKYELTDDKSGIKILEYIGKKGGKVVIPAKIENIPVVALGNVDRAIETLTVHGNGFKELTEKRIDELKADAKLKKYKADLRHNTTSGRTERVTSVIIPNSVTYIKGDVFRNCEAIKSVKLPKNLTFLGGFGNSSITSIVIPEGVTHIDNYAFSGSKKLASVTMPESLKTIGTYAFSDCVELTKIKLPSHPITYVTHSSSAFNILSLTSTHEKRYEYNAPPRLIIRIEDYRTENNGYNYGSIEALVEEPENDAFRNCPKLSLSTRSAIEASGYKGRFD